MNSDLVDILLNPVTTFVMGILTILISRNSNRLGIARERLEYVYHPLFLSIEPFLYKEVCYKDVSLFIAEFYRLESTYSLFMEPSLRQHIHNLSKDDGPYTTDKYGYNKWFLICDYISKEYDKLCRQSNIPVRSMRYRLNYKQYKSKASMFFVELVLNLPAIVFFSFMLGLFSPVLLLIAYLLFVIFLIFKIIGCL